MRNDKVNIQHGIELTHERMYLNYLYGKRNGQKVITPNDIRFYAIEFAAQEWTHKCLEKMNDTSFSQMDEYYNKKLDKIVSEPIFDEEAYNKQMNSLEQLQKLSRNAVMDDLYKYPYLLLLQPYDLLHHNNEDIAYYRRAEKDKFIYIAERYRQIIEEIDYRYQQGLIDYDSLNEEMEIMNYNFFESNGIDQKRSRLLADIILEYELLPRISSNIDIEKTVYDYSSSDTDKMLKKRKTKEKIKKMFKIK